MSKNKGGRPSKYESDVLPRFAEITEWLNAGATDKEIAENLGVNKATFCEYKKQYTELNELVKNGRRKAIQAIKAALFKRATGFSYEEKTETYSEKSGYSVTTVTKFAVPDPACAMILLKHWDKDGNGKSLWTNDPASYELKKEELELKKKQSEEW